MELLLNGAYNLLALIVCAAIGVVVLRVVK